MDEGRNRVLSFSATAEEEQALTAISLGTLRAGKPSLSQAVRKCLFESPAFNDALARVKEDNALKAKVGVPDVPASPSTSTGVA